MYGIHQPIPGGSQYFIEYEAQQRERIPIHLPPVGYTIDRIPDPKTGVPTFDLIKCEILNSELPVRDQKWTRPRLPKDWNKWIDEETRQNRFNKGWVHPEAEKFRAREWNRRVNGVWMAIGNRNNEPSEYVWISPTAYLYFAWWIPDFGHPRFRMVYLKIFHALQYCEDHPLINGLAFAGRRRLGKTAIAGCWTADMPMRMEAGYGGMQAQSGDKAKDFFDINLMQPFRRLIGFFQPKFDAQASQKKKLVFMKTAPKGQKQVKENVEDYDDIKGDEPLGGMISCVTSSETSLDGRKMHRIWLDECGKWLKVDVYKTILKYIPCTEDDLGNKIGLVFAPSTIEEMNAGGQEFVELIEKSFPSKMKDSPNGKTETGLISMFLPAYEGYVCDEYGRSVIEDPKPGEIIVGEDGKPIIKGAKTKLLEGRAAKKSEDDRVEEIRKRPWTWFEAKLTSSMKCQFNAMILTKRIEELYSMPRMPFIRGNYEWVDEEDGDVEFVRDDVSGRFQVHWFPDEVGEKFEGESKIINNLGFEWEDGVKMWYPKNDRLFAIGGDPFKYKTKGSDPRLSKGAAHVFRKYDPSIDHGKDRSQWDSHNFVVQYLFRPDDFDVYGEDMIKLCRYWGTSILIEDNVTDLRQYFDRRNYSRFILYKRHFDEDTLKSANYKEDVDKTVKTNDEVINAYIRRLNSWFNRHGHRCVFPEILQQALNFDPNNTQFSDCVVSAGYTLIASEKRDSDTEYDEKPLDLNNLFPLYDNSGTRSKFYERIQR